MKNCPYCGTLIKETTFGRKFCPNCGIIPEEETENESKEESRSYIG